MLLKRAWMAPSSSAALLRTSSTMACSRAGRWPPEWPSVGPSLTGDRVALASGRLHVPTPPPGSGSSAHHHHLLQPLAPLYISRLQVYAVGPALPAQGQLIRPVPATPSPLPYCFLNPPLHVPEAANAQQRLLVGGEHDVGLGVQR
jgi:hypothetical protein